MARLIFGYKAILNVATLKSMFYLAWYFGTHKYTYLNAHIFMNLVEVRPSVVKIKPISYFYIGV